MGSRNGAKKDLQTDRHQCDEEQDLDTHQSEKRDPDPQHC